MKALILTQSLRPFIVTLGVASVNIRYQTCAPLWIGFSDLKFMPMGENNEAKQSSVARGRWKLLRNALLDNRSPTRSSKIDVSRHSIHSFGGYRMLPSQWVTAKQGEDEDYETLLENLCNANHDFIYSLQDIPRLIQVMEALGVDTINSPIRCQCDRDTTDVSAALPSGWNIEFLSNYDVTGSSSLYRIRRDRSISSSEFGIKAYRNGHDSTSTTLFVHERRIQRNTLQDLVRHRTTGIDNTGNVCIWDAAQTLAWVMSTLQDRAEIETCDSAVILELGAGMAALSSLMMLKQWKRRGLTPKVVITDGQMESVENNVINRLLLEPELRSHVECLLLPWSLDVNMTESIQATTTLVADCTHFEEYHGELFWTMLFQTAVGGSMYLCQPKRGKSWLNFAFMVEKVNECSASPVVEVTELTFTELEQKKMESDPKTTGFRADIHHPHIFSFLKLRQETWNDQQIIMETIHSRKKE